MTSGGEDPCCKVGRVIEEYHLAGLNESLQQRHARGDSLRSLEEFVNVRVLESQFQEMDTEVLGDVESIYDLLMAEDERVATRAELRAKLNRHDVNVASLTAEFVSHTTIRHHLHDCLGIDTSREATVTLDRERATMEWARRRSLNVLEESLSRLVQAGELETGELEVTQTVRITCRDCGTSFRFDELLDTGGCGCNTDE